MIPQNMDAASEPAENQSAPVKTGPDPRLTDVVAALTENSPGRVLPAHKRYSLSFIASEQAARIKSSEFAKAAAQGVSPEAHAANVAADEMAKAVGLAPPPMPAPVPVAPVPGQQQPAAPGQDFGSFNGTVQGQGMPGPGTVAPAAVPGATPGTVQGNQPPPGTYFDPTIGKSVFDPNYHGPYMPIPSGQPGNTAVASVPRSPNAAPERPVHKYADIDQKKIDDAWQLFDMAMSRQPQAANPAEVRDIGLGEIFAMVAAGAIDPNAGMIIGKAIFEEPVLAKLAKDKENDAKLNDSIRLWQTDTQRLLNRATNVERSEVQKQHTAQNALDTEYERDLTSYDKFQTNTRIQRSGLVRSLDNQRRDLTTALTSRPLDAETRAQLTEALNTVQKNLSVAQGLDESNAPIFDTDGKPTAQWQKLMSDRDLVDQRYNESLAREQSLIAKTGLTEAQADRVRDLIPHEIDKMDAQTAAQWGQRLRSVYYAMDVVSRMDKREFDAAIASGRLSLDALKASAAEAGKMLDDKTKEQSDLLKQADKDDAAAVKLMVAGKVLAVDQARYDELRGSAKAKREQAQRLQSGITKLEQTKSGTDYLLGQFQAPKPTTGSGPSVSEIEGQMGGRSPKVTAFVAAAQDRIGKSYKWGAGRSDGPDSSMDCSGLVCDALEQAGLPSVGATADEQMRNTKSVDTPEPGDLLFFDWNGDGKADHVGIYKGGRTMIEASSSAKKVKETTLDESRLKKLVKIGRIGQGSDKVSPDRKPTARKPRGKQTAGPPAPKSEAHFGSQDMVPK